MIPYLTNLEQLNKLLSFLVKYKEIYKYIYGASLWRYFVSCVKCNVDIQFNFLCPFKEWFHQKINKQKSDFTSKEDTKRENTMGKDLGKNTIQGNGLVKGAVKLDQREVLYLIFILKIYFDFDT